MNYPNVINLHLTEICNYKCTYCFAEFNVEKEYKLNDWKKVVDTLKIYFDKYNLKGRINLAGGEPTILPYIYDLIDYISNLNIDVSIITNASQLSITNIDKMINKVSMIGVSIDSINRDKNIEIGRCAKNKTLDYNELVNNLKYIKANKIILKVNTVISKLNLNEDITKLYNDVNFERVKLLQVKINENSNEDAKEFEVTDQEFNDYVCKVKGKYQGKIVVESTDDIEDSYVIIDPSGYLVSNHEGVHKQVGNVLENSLEDLLLLGKFNSDKFNSRY